MAVHSHDEVAKVAYELYVKGGFLQGRDLDDWLEAERIVSQGDAMSHPSTEPQEKRPAASGHADEPAGNLQGIPESPGNPPRSGLHAV